MVKYKTVSFWDVVTQQQNKTFRSDVMRMINLTSLVPLRCHCAGGRLSTGM